MTEKGDERKELAAELGEISLRMTDLNNERLALQNRANQIAGHIKKLGTAGQIKKLGQREE